MEQSDLIFFAFRYCLWRRTYASQMMINHLLEHWNDLKEGDRETIVKEIKEILTDEKKRDLIDFPAWQDFLIEIGEGNIYD